MCSSLNVWQHGILKKRISSVRTIRIMKSILDLNTQEEKTVDFTELVEYIYHGNRAKKKILIKTSDLNNSKDIFCFCLDLFCKGIVMCHGDESRRVEVETLTMEQLQEVIDKLAYTGIMTIIQVVMSSEGDENTSDHRFLKDSVDNIYKVDDNAVLQDFNFKLKVKNMVYVIRFELTI